MKFSFTTLISSVVIVFGVALALPTVAQTSDQTPEKTAPAKSSSPEMARSDARANSDTYIIGAEDILAINVWKEPDLTRAVPVRPDGKITLPLIGDVVASGHTPKQLQESIAKALAAYVANPDVTVIVTEVHSQKFNIVGEVAKPGTYDLTRPMKVLDALALAGGLKDFANGKKIYVLRTSPDGSQTRLPFNYKQVIKGENLNQNVTLQPRDTIVVP